MGPEAAVNAVYANKIAAIEDAGRAREQFVADAAAPSTRQDVDLERLVADLVLDGVVEADALRAELLLRLRYAARRDRHFADQAPRRPPGLTAR